MNLLFVVAHGESGVWLRGLSDACRRNGVRYSVFFTGDGVRTLSAPDIVERAGHASEAVVCEYSWSRVMKGRTCPLALGSQTDHSRMLGRAVRVVSLDPWWSGAPMRVCRWSAGSPSSNAFAGVILFILAAAAPAAAADPKEIRDRSLCPAELLVVRADARKYFEAEPGARLARGLRNRISAALATLPITCRRYAAATSMPFDDETAFVARIRQLRRWFGAGERMRFTEALDALTSQAPFPTARFLHDRSGDRDERDAGAVYRQLCHGCHAAPMAGSENPAEPLDDMARSLPREEFFARMLLGVRGTPEIGLSNPLTASEIGAMRRFLVAGRTPGGELDRSLRR